MPHFSVIMPLYNKAPYVRKAMESVVWQTCADWELIVVDDGSTDDSATIVESIRDPRIRLIRQANAGVGAARNKGVAESSAPHICFLDADDWWEPTFLEEMACLIEKHPTAGIYGTGYWIVKNGKKRLAPIGVDNAFVEGEINYCQVYAKTLCMPLWTGAVCMPRKVFDEQEGFPIGIKLGEDFLLWIRVALRYNVVFLNKPLSNYNQDVDITFRGTHHLHEPKYHMMWHLNEFMPMEKSNPDYKQLVDNLRCYNLSPYYLDYHYRQAAKAELAKVNWSHQSPKTRWLYNAPIWLIKLRHTILEIGSKIKQSIIA